MIGLKDSGPAPPSVPPTGSRARERTAQALEYYNNNLQRARLNAGLSAPRSSYNDNHHTNIHKKQYLPVDVLYRSNSSLELLDHQCRPSNSSSPVTLKREYGSHGSIDIIDRPAIGTSESFFAMLQEYKPTVLDGINTDQRSPGPSEYLRGKVDAQDLTDGNNSEDANSNQLPPQSPKLRVKLTRFWGSGSVSNSLNKNQKQTMDDSIVNNSMNSSNITYSAESEEIARRRAFTHYDCQSLTTNLAYTMRLRRNLLAKRRNTTTGASAASMISNSSNGDGESSDDLGDGQNNELVESCPFFRNEIGGEEERNVSLTRLHNGQQHANTLHKPLHRPALAYGIAVLEFPPGETHWRHSTCPYQRLPRPIESVDQGALYYRRHFMGLEHQNWFGMDEQLGPIAISIRREKVAQNDNQSTSLIQYQYRLIIRTSELLTLRGAILEDSIPNIKASSNSKAIYTKEVLEYVAPEIQINCLKLGVQSSQTEEQLLKLDEQGLTNHYKVGIMYCKAQQSSEEEMYNNEEAGPAFKEFLETIGKTVRLKDFDKYKAGLDNKSDSTGLYSVYSTYQDCEIMFHVSTMLPFTPNNRQQLLRKRHIGNDIVTIVFQEPGAYPFTPKGIRSQFQHVFIVVRAINPCTENTHYKIAVSRSKDVQVFGPTIKDGAVFPKGKAFAEFLLAKVVNAENAAHRSDKFVTMATRTRQEYLKDLVSNFATTTPVDTGQKFSIFSKKKEKIRLRFLPDICQRGAILWQVLLDDCGQSQQIECFLGISADTFVLIEEVSKQIVFVTPCKSILGWTAQTSNSLRIYHHQGECVNIHMRDVNCDRDELMEVVDRLKAVTHGVHVKELTLKRNIMGQLGFHVQPDGIVTLVESQGQAWQGGLRQNSRLVEICKVAVSTLTYDSMVDLLKTSTFVTLTVIPPAPDGTPRKGCTLQNCKYNEGNYEGDYENVASDDIKTRKAPHGQRAVPGNHRIYDRSFSPPRSSNSSGYGTGSSSKSYTAEKYHANEGTLTSSSSGQSSEDRWYDLLQETIELEGIDKLGTVNNRGQVSNRVNEYNNKYLSVAKSSNNYQISQSQTSHSHFRAQNMQHNKIHSSHSLPLSQISYPSLQPAHDQDIPYEMEKNNLLKQQNECKSDNISSSTPRNAKVSDYGLLAQFNNDLSKNTFESHSVDNFLSDRLCRTGSEDELSTASSKSPKSNRHKQLGSLSSSNSRNQSPRSIHPDAKLRPGVSNRTSNRNSANLSSSTLQEELMRLINPDETCDPMINKEMAVNLMSESSNNPLTLHNNPPEVILTMARPATVISNTSTTSSPLPSEFKSSSNERLLPSSSVSNKLMATRSEALPLPEDMDWPSLVDTATRAMKQVSVDTDAISNDSIEAANHWDIEISQDISKINNVSTSISVPELQNHYSDIISRETRRRLSLENEVRRLKEENRKLVEEKRQLQDQVHATTSQLRKFTEWFFKNVQRQ